MAFVDVLDTAQQGFPAIAIALPAMHGDGVVDGGQDNNDQRRNIEEILDFFLASVPNA